MAGFDTSRLFGMFDALAEVMAEQKDHLCALDGEIGDGDHGIAMALSFAAIRDALADLDKEGVDATTVFNTAAKAFLNAVGGSTGPLYATAFMRAGAALKGKVPVGDEDVAGVIAAMAKGIADRGKASIGDKTMLDAWLPAAEAAVEAVAAGAALGDALTTAAEAADAGAQATREMTAKMGRAARLGDRSVGHIDPGAASAAMIVRVIADTLA